MKRVIVILATIALVAALPALLSVGVALAEPGGAATPAEYAGALLTILVSVLGCAACLLSLRAAPRGWREVSALALAAVAPPAILGAFFAVGLSGYAPLVALLNLLDPTLLWVVILTLALAAPLFALTKARGWRLAPVARRAAR